MSGFSFDRYKFIISKSADGFGYDIYKDDEILFSQKKPIAIEIKDYAAATPVYECGYSDIAPQEDGLFCSGIIKTGNSRIM